MHCGERLGSVIVEVKQQWCNPSDGKARKYIVKPIGQVEDVSLSLMR